MQTQGSLQARLADRSAIDHFVGYFAYHLGGATREMSRRITVPLTEREKLAIAPLAFGLLPRASVDRKSYDDRIKPAIEAHLRALGIEPADDLVEVLKSISDQLYKTRNEAGFKRKKGIADLQANRPLYQQIKARQNERCATCGVRFDGSIQETLDHIIPYRLVGDVSDGSNWQILCQPCNGGKGNFISAHKSKEFFNWNYSKNRAPLSLWDETRFLVLCHFGRCQSDGCGKSANEIELFVDLAGKSGLYIFDNLTVYCKDHSI